MNVKVWAKLNLSLNVGKGDQFHQVDSVAMSVSLCDQISVKPLKTKQVVVTGCKHIPLHQNTAFVAATAFVQRFNTNGCKISIKKRIPVGAGMGGSSADAAAVIACMCHLYGVDKNSAEVAELCAQVGSDVHFMLHGGVARLTGKGEQVAHLDDYPDLFFAVTFFPHMLFTKQVYAQFDKLQCNGDVCDNDLLQQLLLQRKAKQAILMFANALQQPALSLSNFANNYIEFCKQHNLHCTMTGSGSAFFVAFDNLQQARQATKLLCAHGFATKCLSYVSWGIQTTNLFFRVV